MVCGGGEVGCETAEFIAQTVHDVTVLEMKPQILTDMVAPNMAVLIQRMAKQQIKIHSNATVCEITEDSVSYKAADGAKITIPANTVVCAFGYQAYNPLEKAARANCSQVYVIGSAAKAGNALIATHDGYEAGCA